MQSYRLYILNVFSDGIDHQREFAAKDDGTAIWISEGMRHTRPMELWHGSSKIHRWEAIEEAALEAGCADISLVSQPVLMTH
jgi:hypothetical protein